MSTKRARSLQIPLTSDSFVTADQMIEQWLKRMHIRDEIILETKLLFETLFDNLLAQGFDEKTILTIKLQNVFGETCIKLGFEGKSYVPDDRNTDDSSPELKILLAYNDKVDFSYRLGYNSIRIVVKRNYRRSLMYCAVGALLAIIVYLLMRAYTGVEEQTEINHNFISPLIKQFANAMLMVGAPVTLFSMIKNLTEIYIVSEKSSSGRKLQVKTIVTSLIAVVLALGVSFLVAVLLRAHQGDLGGTGTFGSGLSFSEALAAIVPASIFEPFETYLPFPIIIVALLVTYAFCSVGKYFDILQKAVNVCFTLFSRMLNVVMFTLPFFCFLAILAALLAEGFSSLLLMAQSVGLVLLSLVVMAGFYLIRLWIGGVKILPFVRHLPTLIWENYKINSAIDAVPFNIRYCARKYGYSRKRLSEKLPILAQTNQDGNCYLIMLIAMIFIFLLGVDVSWFHVAGIAILVLFLSFGAPNQPGSIVIGMLIITFFLQADRLITIAIYAEIFFGAIQNIINVIGDIVTVAIEEQKMRE